MDGQNQNEHLQLPQANSTTFSLENNQLYKVIESMVKSSKDLMDENS